MDAPLVSVIIPNYNHAPFLAERIESVLNQTYEPIEIIFLDDYSSDNSREVIERYATQDARIRLVYNTQNSGTTFKQWNKGLALAKGQYIWIAESDDYADVHLLDRLVAKLDADPGVGIAFCNSFNIDENNAVIDDNTAFYVDFDFLRWQSDFVAEGKEIIGRYMSVRNIIPNASAVLLRKSVVDQVAPADESKRILGDWLYWMSILSVCKLAYVSERLNFFRNHTNNVRSSTTKNGVVLFEFADVLARVNHYAEPEPTVYAKGVNYLFSLWFDRDSAESLPLKKHWEIYKRIALLHVNVNSRLFWYLFHNRRKILREKFGVDRK